MPKTWYVKRRISVLFLHATFWNRIPSIAWVNGLVSDNGGCWSESWFIGCTRFRRITQRVRLGRLNYSLWQPFVFVSVTFWILYDALVGCSIRLSERVWWTVVDSTDLSNFFFTPSVECTVLVLEHLHSFGSRWGVGWGWIVQLISFDWVCVWRPFLWAVRWTVLVQCRFWVKTKCGKW